LRTANRNQVSIYVPQQVIEDMDKVTYKLSLPTRSDSLRYMLELSRDSFKYEKVETKSKDNTRVITLMLSDTLANFISDKATIHKVPRTKILRCILKAEMEKILCVT